jgi:hypothetical protein
MTRPNGQTRLARHLLRRRPSSGKSSLKRSKLEALEALDLVVDPKSREVTVNPASPDIPLLDALHAREEAASPSRAAPRAINV